MDGLSAAATIIALIEVTAKLIGICWKYKGVKSAARTAKRLINQLEGLKSLLVKVDEILEETEPPDLSRHRVLTEWTASRRLKDFHESLEQLIQELQPPEGIKAVKHVLFFPLQQQDLENALEEIERMKTSLNLALTVDHSAQLGTIEAGVLDVRREQQAAKDAQLLEAIQKWLAAPDVAANQAHKQGERQGDTGLWLLRMDLFTRWLVRNNTLLWIHGIPGSGKSVLCSMVVRHVLDSSPKTIDKIAIYYYFDISEESKRSTENMIRAFISQLAYRKMNNRVLNDTYHDCQDARRVVTQAQLMSTLFSMLDDYIDVVIIIDAIDEAVDVQNAMQIVTQICDRKLGHVHMLLTSRWTRAIEARMTEAQAYVVELSSHNVERDISAYVHDRVNHNPKWSELIKARLSERIICRAAGLFRLASCLIDLVAECRTIRRLNEVLESLPGDLNAVYERILLRIQSEDKIPTKRMLEWLAFSGRPLRISELTHAIAVDHADLQGFCHEDLDIAPFESPLLCSSLVVKARASVLDVASVPAYYSSTITATTELEFEEVRLAHASVRDYLLSEGLRNSAAKDFYLDTELAHRNIAETCLLYLLNPDLRFGVVTKDRYQNQLTDWPLLPYAAHFWPDHINASPQTLRNETWNLIKLLFETRHAPLAGNYGTWASTLTPGISLAKIQATTPLYYAASFGLAEVTAKLLRDGANAHINEPGGRFKSTPLEVAAYRGRLEVVKLLLAAGGDPNTKSDPFQPSTLAWAISRNHTAVAICLMENGAVLSAGEWRMMRRHRWVDLAEYCHWLWVRWRVE